MVDDLKTALLPRFYHLLCEREREREKEEFDIHILIINFPLCPQLYTVVQHVKHFNDVVEFGENQEFTDDFEYLATGLKSGQPLNTRCLR